MYTCDRYAESKTTILDSVNLKKWEGGEYKQY